jgi:uncharacterized YigZ family protein
VFKEKSSKFIGVAKFCSNLSDVNEIINKLKKEHPQASHFCYAYSLGTKLKQIRANDDGEPSNSAGIPILGQINAFNVTNVLVVVIRYYGGVKLGVGGLVQAYKNGAKEALINAEIEEFEIGDYYSLEFSYDKLVELMNYLKMKKIKIENNQIGSNCSVRIYLPLSKSQFVLEDINKIKGIEIHKNTI